MLKFDIKIQDPEGLHARPASRLVSLCHKYESEIIIYHKGIEANCKNITEVLALGVEKGDKIIIEIDGSDEAGARHALIKMLKDKSPEKEGE